FLHHRTCRLAAAGGPERSLWPQVIHYSGTAFRGDCRPDKRDDDSAVAAGGYTIAGRTVYCKLHSSDSRLYLRSHQPPAESAADSNGDVRDHLRGRRGDRIGIERIPVDLHEHTQGPWTAQADRACL